MLSGLVSMFFESFMLIKTNLSNCFIFIDVSAPGQQSFKPEIVEDFRTGMMITDSNQVVNLAWAYKVLDIFVWTSLS